MIDRETPLSTLRRLLADDRRHGLDAAGWLARITALTADRAYGPSAVLTMAEVLLARETSLSDPPYDLGLLIDEALNRLDRAAADGWHHFGPY